MSKLIVSFDGSGEIEGWRYVSDDSYSPGEGELEWEGDHRNLGGLRIDVDSDPPELVPDPTAEWQRPGVVDADTREIISEKFRDAGADAIAALDASDAAAFMDASIRMQYLTYVSLTGDRIESVEDRFF